MMHKRRLFLAVFAALLFCQPPTSVEGTATYHNCPPPDSGPLHLDVRADPAGTISVSFPSQGYGGDVCVLSLLVQDAEQPVARSYDGRDWEVRAGAFAGRVEEPSCTAGGVCTFNIPIDGNTGFILRSYSHSASRKAEVARFLEQTTFGPNLAGINALSVTSASDGSPDFASWVEYQMDSTSSGVGMNAHREFFRIRTNPRFEYPFPGGGAGPYSACEMSSRWRTFALTERDGINSMKTNMNKYLSIKKKGSRYVYYVEGMARTTTNGLGKIRDVNGKTIRRLQTEKLYKINSGKYFNDNMKYSCIGCPVRICASFGCGYIQNPKVDMAGIAGTGSVPYQVVDLPNIMAGDNKMVPIDDGPYVKELSKWQKPNDEFYLNTSINQGQCSGHPTTILPVPSKITDLLFWEHPASASPPIFGRTMNSQTGVEEYMLFDPIFKFHENTVENPMPDGGGRLMKITQNTPEEDGQSGQIFCSNAPRTFSNEDHCKLSFDPLACFNENGVDKYGNGRGVVVCGSPGEVASDFTKGVIDGFDLKTKTVGHKNREIYKDGTFTQQKGNIWWYLALTAEDQLRQRMAWALYQIIPIGAGGGFVPRTEYWTVYYDIFVRNAFGNYRDVLKEVSYNQSMAKWLSFLRNSGVQYSLDYEDELHFPDENYAREVMQLFSIGITQLNMDGTNKLDENGHLIPTYTSDDTMSYARIWTGFNMQNMRGNVEQKSSQPRNDPMLIDRERRDLFPKSNLFEGFIGDDYPLCVDLPDKDFLRKGATYRLLGSRSSPELQHDEAEWEENGVRLDLHQSSPLHTLLCAPGVSGVCTFPAKIILDENIVYDDSTKTGAEYEVDTIRSVRVHSDSAPIFYEYLRPPCVHQHFFNNGQKIIAGSIGSDLVVNDSMCADPRYYLAAESCCPPGWESNGDSAIRICSYNGERMKYSSAIDRCKTNDLDQCNPKKMARNICTDTVAYSWSAAGCSVRAKISFEVGHQVARVDNPQQDWAGKRNVKNIVRADTINFFQVPWRGNIEAIPTNRASCDALSSCYSVVDGCICDTHVVETTGFLSTTEISTMIDVREMLRVGAFNPEMFDTGEYSNLGNCGVTGLTVYTRNDGYCSSLDTSTVFLFTDDFGVDRYLKNMVSNVHVDGITPDLFFRNAVHFIDFADRNARDMHYETDAAIDTFFYHPTHAPFLSIRIIQRIAGISNPSPKYVERVSTAYKNGSFMGQFGSGKYGDLGAMVAAALLDPEARSVSLDIDPSHGHIREPLIKIISFFRSMETKLSAPLSVPLLYSGISKTIGQGPYRSDSVFSFFQPEFAPAGVITSAGLVSPEGKILDFRLINLLNGLYSTVKFGYSMCYGGFGDTNLGAACPRQEGVVTEDALGELTYTGNPNSTPDDILDDLSLLLTSSRLSETNREIIKSSFENIYLSGNKAKGIRIAQQLMVSTPEFHSTNLSKPNGNPRLISTYQNNPSGRYKAVVYFEMEGGADSFNLLVPTGNCKNGKDMFAEYQRARGRVKLARNQLLNIDASGSDQVCNTFGVNKKFPLLQKLYAEKQALFIANAGVLAKPLTKYDNWHKESKVHLFAHNHMRNENKEIDPLNENTGTGIGGRMLDILRRQGFHTSSNMVDGSSVFAKGSAFDNNPTWNVNLKAPEVIDKYSTVGPDMLDIVKELNGESESDNSVYGETFSTRITQSLYEYEEGLKMDEMMDDPDFNMDEYPYGSDINDKLRATAQFMKMRGERKVNRDAFIVTHEGYDSHTETVDEVNSKFKSANDALQRFIDEMKRQDIWDDIVIVMGSDFGRSISSNSNGGTDHAWGGNYFMIGGSLNGGQILGEYPEHLSSASNQWIGRGRLIPSTPLESIWNGVANWMGVHDENDLDHLLPNRDNFKKCIMFTDKDLFIDGQVPSSTCSITNPPTLAPVNSNPTTLSPIPLPTPLPTPVPTVFSTKGPTSQPTTPVPTAVVTESPAPAPTSNPTPDPIVQPTTSPTTTPIGDVTPVNNVLNADSLIIRVGGTASGGEQMAVDGTTSKFLVFKDDTMAPGFEATPAYSASVVTGIRVYNANDGKNRDPTKFVIEGRNNEVSNWELISEGNLLLSYDRNEQGLEISSEPGLHFDGVAFSNSRPYSHYRVTFPETRKISSSIMQVAEVELPGYLIPNDVSGSPTKSPTVAVTQSPTTLPTPIPTAVVTEAPAPTSNPTSAPSNQPTSSLTEAPTPDPTPILTQDLTSVPTQIPTPILTQDPTSQLTSNPTPAPSFQPTVSPTEAPTQIPTPIWTQDPTSAPTSNPTPAPSVQPTASLTKAPMQAPTPILTQDPTSAPIFNPTPAPIDIATEAPAPAPTSNPTPTPSSQLTVSPTKAPTQIPTPIPTQNPTLAPTSNPTLAPSVQPTAYLTKEPTQAPTPVLTQDPTSAPFFNPTPAPIDVATEVPAPAPTSNPTLAPSAQPIRFSTSTPTGEPTQAPMLILTQDPTSEPTSNPTLAPTTVVTEAPAPAPAPTSNPTPVVTTKSPTPSTPNTGTPVNTVLDPQSNVALVGTENTKSTNIFDGTTNRMTFKTLRNEIPGFIATPTHPLTIVKGICIYNAKSHKLRDPTKYAVEGRNGGGDTWHMIAQGDIHMSRKRNQEGTVINSTPNLGDPDLRYGREVFENDVAYSQYRVTFPATKGDTYCSIAEVELPGILLPDGPVLPTLAPTTVVTEVPVPAPAPTSNPTPVVTIESPTPSTPNIGTPVNTVLDPQSNVALVGTENTKSTNIFDGTTNSMTFKTLRNEIPGFVVTPTNPVTIAKEIRIYNANSYKLRDPTKYTVEGRNAGEDTWHMIAQGDIHISRKRNPKVTLINSTPNSGDPDLRYGREVFENNVAYSQYRVTFPATKGDSYCSMAEVELPGIAF